VASPIDPGVAWRRKPCWSVDAAPTRATFERVADATVDGARTFQHNEFKIELARRAIVRALECAAAAPSL
jgi:CO/xanthine dehydrogenase FAD-binding subunit